MVLVVYVLTHVTSRAEPFATDVALNSRLIPHVRHVEREKRTTAHTGSRPCAVGCVHEEAQRGAAPSHARDGCCLSRQPRIAIRSDSYFCTCTPCTEPYLTRWCAPSISFKGRRAVRALLLATSGAVASFLRAHMRCAFSASGTELAMDLGLRLL